MAFSVEDGTGVADANSYISLEDAEAYFEDRGSDEWDQIDDALKPQLLVKATDYIEATYAGQWVGWKAYGSTQGLSWPRQLGLLIGVPKQLRYATAELALIANTTPLMPTVTRGKKSVKIGPIQVEYNGDSNLAPDFVAASQRLAPYLIGFAGGSNNLNVRAIRT